MIYKTVVNTDSGGAAQVHVSTNQHKFEVGGIKHVKPVVDVFRFQSLY